jgi:hypothetical protein
MSIIWMAFTYLLVCFDKKENNMNTYVPDYHHT